MSYHRSDKLQNPAETREQKRDLCRDKQGRSEKETIGTRDKGQNMTNMSNVRQLMFYMVARDPEE